MSDFLLGSYGCSSTPLNPQSLFTNIFTSSSEGSFIHQRAWWKLHPKTRVSLHGALFIGEPGTATWGKFWKFPSVGLKLHLCSSGSVSLSNKIWKFNGSGSKFILKKNPTTEHNFWSRCPRDKILIQWLVLTSRIIASYSIVSQLPRLTSWSKNGKKLVFKITSRDNKI